MNAAPAPGPVTPPVVPTVEALKSAPAEFQEACRKIVISHAINELYGSRVFDEPAVALAPTPYAKWQVCRVVMEEYGHHYRFFELGREMGIAEERMLPEKTAKKPLNIFDLKLESWEQFCVIKMIGDLAEILQVEDLVHCSFHPLRNLARMTMPEERFHAEFGETFVAEILERPGGRALVQRHLDRLFPEMVKFFGAAGSKNNEMYRRWGIKKRSNEEMRADYIRRATELCAKYGLTLPKVG
jgi:ring-1,2-phenylacetyl-CoA epoxidase subunit PaaA